MTDRTPTTEAGRHPVYPGGPDCQPNCPGPWSDYHDGYADGYENAEARAGLVTAGLSVAAYMVRGTGVCERPHRNGEANPHIHFDDDYIRRGRDLAAAALTRGKP
jgi:hypothetical protein